LNSDHLFIYFFKAFVEYKKNRSPLGCLVLKGCSIDQIGTVPV